MSYVYFCSEPGCYTVGHYAPDGKWHPESDHAHSEIAAARCNYLNGGADLNAELHPHLKAFLQEISGELSRVASLLDRRTRAF